MQRGADYLFPDHIRDRNTGRPYDPVRWIDGQERRDDLTRQSRWIANALERQGIRAREDGDEAVDIDHILGTVTPVERFRSVRFLPTIMQRDSAAMLSSLRYFMHNHVLGSYVRMFTITGGARIPAFGPLRDRHRTITRAISKWASEARLLYGVEFLFRAMEYTRDPGDPDPLEVTSTPPLEVTSRGASYHMHAHVLATPTEFMGEEGWERFLRWSHAFLSARMPGATYAFHDCGRIQEPDEACKYPFKPGDLATCGDAEIAWLHGEFFRANLKQPLGAFRDFNHQLAHNTRETGEVQITRDVDEETGEFTETRCPVTVRSPLKVLAVYPEDGSQTARLEIVHKRPRPRHGDRDEQRTHDRDPGAVPVMAENRILFTSNPTSTSCPWATVKTRVVGYTETPGTRLGFEGLMDLNMITREVRASWERNGAPPPHRIPLIMEREAAMIESRGASNLAESNLFRSAHHIDCQTAAHDRAAQEAATSGKRAKKLRDLAQRLRNALGPVEGGQAVPAEAYSVHTCSLTVRDSSADGEATGVHSPRSDFETPPRSHFDPPSKSLRGFSETPKTGVLEQAWAPVPDVRPWHTLPPIRLRDPDVLARAPIRVCAAVRDYEAWWQANHGRAMRPVS